MAINLSLPGLVDLRQPILGDSFGWEGTEPAAAKKSLVIHHSASDTNQDAFDIAAYHVNHNGWGGIGYHFVITNDQYGGRPGFCQPGAQIQYVGDLGSWRAHVLNSNPGRVGICLVGNFVTGVPGREQLRLAKVLIDYLMSPNNILPSINYFSQVTGHGLIPGQQTECPGYQSGSFNTWFNYLKGQTTFPDSLYAPTPAPPTPPPAPEQAPPPADPTESKGSGQPTGQVNLKVVPAGITWEYLDTPVANVVQRDGAYAKDPFNNRVLDSTREHLLRGTEVQTRGYFQYNGEKFVRTVYAYDHDQWTGVPLIFFQPPDILEPEKPGKILENGFLELPPEQRRSLLDLLGELVAMLASPLIKILGIKTKGNS